jgi:hypothetical protein
VNNVSVTGRKIPVMNSRWDPEMEALKRRIVIEKLQLEFEESRLKAEESRQKAEESRQKASAFRAQIVEQDALAYRTFRDDQLMRMDMVKEFSSKHCTKLSESQRLWLEESDQNLALSVRSTLIRGNNTLQIANGEDVGGPMYSDDDTPYTNKYVKDKKQGDAREENDSASAKQPRVGAIFKKGVPVKNTAYGYGLQKGMSVPASPEYVDCETDEEE